MNENEMPVNGWIKLSRGIRQNWVWNNPNWLKWWLDLLLLAAWEDTVIRKRRRRVLVRRGEVVMSERELQARWGVRGKSVIRDFLTLLIEDEMITKSYRPCADHFSDRKSDRKFDRKEDRNSDRKEGHNSDHNSDHKGGHYFTVLTICNYDSFQTVARGAATTFKTASATTNTTASATTSATTNATASTSTNATTNATRINKEIKNKRSLDVADAAREEAKIEIFEEESFWNEILSAGTNPLLESACAEMKITMEEARELGGQIVREWAARKIVHTGRDNAGAHFFSHLRKKVEALRKRQAGNAREQARASVRAQSEAAIRAAMGGGVLRNPEPDTQLQRRPEPAAPTAAPADGLPSADELEQRWQNVVDITADDYDDYDELV